MSEANIYDIIIIGSGPSGLTAGIYTSRASLKTLLIAGKKWGGQLQLTTEVENFPGFPEGIAGPELMDRMRKQALKFGVEIKDSDVSNIDVLKRPFTIIVESKTYQAKAVIVATGADTKWLGVKGESDFIGKGVSSCAPCDAFFYKDKDVLVVGGGDSAMEEALVLTKFAKNVTIVHRRDEFRASRIMKERVLNHDKIKVLWNSEVVEIKGKQTVQSVVLKSKFQSQNFKRNPNSKVQTLRLGEQIPKNSIITERKDTIHWELPIDGVFVAVGHVPNTKLFRGKIDLDEKGYIRRNQKSKIKNQNPPTRMAEYKSMTSAEGVFVAGDVHDYAYKQAITAAGYGAEAALDAEKWLERRLRL